MAKIVVNSDFLKSVMEKVDIKTELLLEYIDLLGEKVKSAKEVYDSSNTSGQSFCDMKDTIDKIKTSYYELNERFKTTIKEVVQGYSDVDKAIVDKDGVVSYTSIPLVAGINASNYPNMVKDIEKLAVKDSLSSSSSVVKMENMDFSYPGTISLTYKDNGAIMVQKDGKNLGYINNFDAQFITRFSGYDIERTLYLNKNKRLYDIYSQGRNFDEASNYSGTSLVAAYEAGKMNRKISKDSFYEAGILMSDKNNTKRDASLHQIAEKYEKADVSMKETMEKAIFDSSLTDSEASQVINQLKTENNGD